MCTIVQEPHPALRAQAKPVAASEIGSERVNSVIAGMKTALHREPDGVAIAAPQIAESLRIFVVAGFVFDLKKKNIGATPSLDKVFINPEIIKSSKEQKWIPGEGCLSVRWVYGKARRHASVTVRATDENGKEFTMDAKGLLAQIFQHEIDHLNGILFIDHAKDLKEMTDDEIADYQREMNAMANRA